MSHSYQNLELGERASLSGRGSGGYESEPSLLKQYRTVITAIGAVAVVCLVGVVAYSSRSTTLATAAGPLLSSSATTSDFDAAATTLSLAEKKSSKSSENEKGELSAPLSAEAVCLDPNYTKVTLKLANEMTMAGLFPDLKGERKFEASDVIRVENHYLVIYDNLYQIGKIHQQLDFHNTANVLLNSNPERKGDSGFEAIVYDEPSGVFYVVIEAELEAGDKFHRAHIDSVSSDKDREKLESSPSAEAQFHATIEEVEFHEDSKEYKLKDKCKTQFKFISGNKGFEGAAHVNQGEDGIIMMGLCEGNFCEGGKRGRQVGNGRIVLMRKKDATDSEACTWETISLLALPKLAAFSDYSALAVRPVEGEKNVYRIAVTSQESSQVWIGELKTSKDAKDWSLTDGVVYNFPRSESCEIEYCNIEGISFVDDNLLVAVSDKMKGGGRQHYRCLGKDQSIHTFVLP